MIMPKEKREIQKSDIMPLEAYIKNRKELRKNIVSFKKEWRPSTRGLSRLLWYAFLGTSRSLKSS